MVDMTKFLINTFVIISGITILMISGNTYAMSFSQAENIYTKITNANSVPVHPRFIYSNSRVVNASSGGFRITINQGMLSFVGGDSNQMALVIGHELAHYKLGHGSSTPSNEYAADRLGAQYMQHAGYNKCAGAVFLKRLSGGDSSTHPASYKRVKALGC